MHISARTFYRLGQGRGYLIIIIIMYIYHALINALSAHMIHINLNVIFYTHVKHVYQNNLHKVLFKLFIYIF